MINFIKGHPVRGLNLKLHFRIHQSVITGALLDPFMIQNINENMLAFANHQAIPNILCSPLVNNFGLLGGSATRSA